MQQGLDVLEQGEVLLLQPCRPSLMPSSHNQLHFIALNTL